MDEVRTDSHSTSTSLHCNNEENTKSEDRPIDQESEEEQAIAVEKTIAEVVLSGALQHSLLSEEKAKITCQHYLRLRYINFQPLPITEYKRLQELSRSLGSRIVTILEELWSKAMAEKRKKAEELRREKEKQRHIDEELQAVRDSYNALGYDPLSNNLTREQEEREKARCEDAALLIFGRSIQGIQEDKANDPLATCDGPSSNLSVLRENSPFASPGSYHLVPIPAPIPATNNLDEELDLDFEQDSEKDSEQSDKENINFNLMDKEFDELIETAFQPIGYGNLDQNPSDGRPTKRPKAPSIPPTTQATPPPPKSTHVKLEELETTKEREIVSSRPTTTKKGSQPRDKTAKKVFAAVERRLSQHSDNLPMTTFGAPKSAYWSWGDSNGQVPATSTPSPRNAPRSGPIHSRENQNTIPQDLLPRPLFHRGHKRGISSPPRSLTPTDTDRASILRCDQAISPEDPPRKDSISSLEVQRLKAQEAQPPKYSFDREHQRSRSSLRNLPISAGPNRPSLIPDDLADSSLLNIPRVREHEIDQVTSFFGLPAKLNLLDPPTTPTKSRMNPQQPNNSGGSSNMSSQATPSTGSTIKQGFFSQDDTPTRKGLLPPAPSSLPRRPPGPIPSSYRSPAPKLSFGARSSQAPRSTNTREIATITFTTWVSREKGMKFLKGIDNYQDQRSTNWRKAHPLYKEWRIVPDSAPESVTFDVCGPVGSNVRGALEVLFEHRHDVTSRIDEP